MAEKSKKRQTGLSIIIVGCGKVGTTIVEALIDEGHDISVIDKDPARIQGITNTSDVFGIVGNGASFTVLQEAGIQDADIFIAVTESDELNLLCCLVAKRAGNCDVIARVRTPDYSAEAAYLKEQLGLAMIINPDQEAAAAIYRILYIPTALSVNSFAKGRAEMVRIVLPAGNVLVGRKLMELGREVSGALLICVVERNGEVIIPDGQFMFAEGDVVTYIAPRRDGRRFLKRIGFHTHQVRSTILIGGGRTSYYLAQHLLNAGVSVKIIEINKNRCEELSEMLPKAVVINGDGSNEEILREAGIETAESVVALTSIDEENIILALHAKDVSDAKVITKINRITFNHVIDQLELGSVIFPKYITAEAIVAFVRAKSASMDSNIETMVHLFGNRVEAIEFSVGANSKVADIPLHQLPLKDHILIACIDRGGSILIPGGNDMIKEGDSVIIVTTHLGFEDITDILA